MLSYGSRDFRTWGFSATCTGLRSHMSCSLMVAVPGFIPQALQWLELWPPESHVLLEPQKVALYGNGVFADVIKVRMEMRIQ